MPADAVELLIVSIENPGAFPPELFRRVARHPAELIVGPFQHPARDDADTHRGRLVDAPQQGFVLHERRLGLLLVRDVENEGLDGHRAVFAVQRCVYGGIPAVVKPVEDLLLDRLALQHQFAHAPGTALLEAVKDLETVRSRHVPPHLAEGRLVHVLDAVLGGRYENHPAHGVEERVRVEGPALCGLWRRSLSGGLLWLRGLEALLFSGGSPPDGFFHGPDPDPGLKLMQFTSSLQAAAVSPVRCGAGLEKRKCLLLLEKIRCPQRLHPERQILQKRCLPASAGRSGNGRVRSS